jgi:hypothetical protein
MGWAGHVARMGEEECICRQFAELFMDRFMFRIIRSAYVSCNLQTMSVLLTVRCLTNVLGTHFGYI